MIAWIRAPDPGDRSALDRWRAGVGPPVIASPPSPPLGLPRSVDSVAVISWNTHVGGGDIVGLVTELEAGGLTGGPPVRHFVLLLQEAYREGSAVPVAPEAASPRRITASRPNAAREDIVTTAARLGLHLYYVPSMANGQPAAGELPEDRGNAILSTLPLTDPAAIELPFESQRRVAVAATMPEMDLRFVSAHLDHRGFGGGRTRQAKALVKALTGERIVMGADLNTWSFPPLEGADRVLSAHFPLPKSPPVEPTFATSARLGGLRLDRIMYRLPSAWAGPVKRIASTFGSDHHPLLGWITPGH